MSFDKNPLVVNTRTISQLPDKLPFIQDFQKRLRVLSRDVEKGRLDKKVDPLSLLQWFEENQISISESFESLLKKNAQKQKVSLGNSVSMNKELELLRKKVELLESINNPSSKRSAYMLILGMAIAKFNHVPKEMRKNMQISGTSKANFISGVLSNYGFNITDETVLSWLEEAYAALDDIKINIPTK